jgi:cytochrome c oxidase cbb3-type subunit III
VKIKPIPLVVSALLAAALSSSRASALDDAATLELYKTKCQACHLADGNAPMKEMNFADAEWKHGSKVADIIKTIEEGSPGTAMLSFKAQLSPEEIDALARYVRAFDKTLKPEKPVKGKK